MQSTRVKVVATLALILGTSAAVAETELGCGVRFLGNAGFAVDTADGTVLVDTFTPDDYGGRFQRVPGDVAAAIESAAPPFDEVVLVLISHEHGDHFDGAALAALLDAETGARAVLNPAAAKGVGAIDPSAEEERLVQVGGAVRSLQAGATSVTAVPVPHVGARFADVHNLAFAIETPVCRVLHLGDAEPSEAALEALAGLSPFDLVLAPAWFDTEAGTSLLRERFAAARLAIYHNPAGDPATGSAGGEPVDDGLLRLRLEPSSPAGDQR